MPQIKVTDTQVAAPKNLQGNLRLGERLRERWSPAEYVRVINIDDEPFQWQWMPSTAEEENFSADGMHRQISGRDSFSDDHKYLIPGKQETWVINPGSSEVLLGENAYLFVEGLYKTLVAKNKVASTPNQPATSARNFNWNDGKTQEEMIDKIFLGKAQPNFDEPVVTKKA
jgi:hypothetical protein